jgi:hypothetical protein
MKRKSSQDSKNPSEKTSYELLQFPPSETAAKPNTRKGNYRSD